MTVAEILDRDKELKTKDVVYKNLKKLKSVKCVSKGIMNSHADTYYILERAIKIIEGKEPDKITQQRKNNTCLSYDSDSVRDKLINIMDRGLMLKSIAVNAGISESELSRFKNGVDALKQSDVKLLAEYLHATVIPVWNVTKEPEMSLRERLLASKNKSEITARELLLANRYRSEEEKKESTKLDALRNLMK